MAEEAYSRRKDDRRMDEFKKMLEEHNDGVLHELIHNRTLFNEKLADMKKDIHGRIDRLEGTLNQTTRQVGELSGHMKSLANQTADQWKVLQKQERDEAVRNALLEREQSYKTGAPSDGTETVVARVIDSPNFKFVVLPICLIIIGLFGWDVVELIKSVWKG